MSNEPWGDDLPAPFPTKVAEGEEEGGVRWEVRASGTREEYTTLLFITFPDGRRTGGGGHGGPALHPGRAMSFSVHRRSDPDVHYFVGRVHPSVDRIQVDLVGAGPSALHMRPVGKSTEVGVTFAAKLLPTTADVVSVEAWDEKGNLIDEQHGHQYNPQRHHDRPDRRNDTIVDRHIDWPWREAP